MMSREDHLERCKINAREYIKRFDVTNAVTSMLSDLNKHPETSKFADVLAQLGMMYVMQNDIKGAERWVEGFR